jgi:hypothetical protein
MGKTSVTNVHVEIDRLVLTGWPLGTGEAAAVRAAVEAELGRLFSVDRAGLLAGGALDRVSAEPVAWTPGGDVSRLGAQVARSVYGSLGK